MVGKKKRYYIWRVNLPGSIPAPKRPVPLCQGCWDRAWAPHRPRRSRFIRRPLGSGITLPKRRVSAYVTPVKFSVLPRSLFQVLTGKSVLRPGGCRPRVWQLSPLQKPAWGSEDGRIHTCPSLCQHNLPQERHRERTDTSEGAAAPNRAVPTAGAGESPSAVGTGTRYSWVLLRPPPSPLPQPKSIFCFILEIALIWKNLASGGRRETEDGLTQAFRCDSSGGCERDATPIRCSEIAGIQILL